MKVFTKQPKALFGIFAIMGVLAAGLLSPTPANAETVTLKANDRLGYVGDGVDLCNVTAVGTDPSGNKLAMSAGHCFLGQVGTRVTKLNAGGLYVPADKRTELGTVVAAKYNPTGIAQSNQLDYAFIQLDDNVEIQTTGNPSTGRPTLGQTAVRHGNDLGFSVTQSSVVVLGLSAREFTITGATGPGASGGPVTKNGKLLGLSSRSAFFYGLPVSIISLADAGIADAVAAGSIEGFQPI